MVEETETPAEKEKPLSEGEEKLKEKAEDLEKAEE